MADVTSLLSAQEMSEKLKGVLSPDRLVELTAAGLLPCYDVDGKTMFGAGETKEWINHNLVCRRPGRHVGNSLVTVVNVTSPKKDFDTVPQELAMIANSLIPICLQSSETAGMSGVYFLCHEKKVVYVGQSKNVFGRVGAHLGNKTFDCVWFVRVPQSDLDYVEGELIHVLKPKYNFDKRGEIVAPSGSGGAMCDESVACVSLVRGTSSEEDDGR